MQEKKHVLITCYDPRIDSIVEDEIAKIRKQGGVLTEKDISRPPGGVHLLAGKTDCRKGFYEMLTAYRDIAKSTVFHLLPHTNCQHCHRHLAEKLGNGTQSDLRFHLRSAEKMLAGVINHFPPNDKLEFDVRIILTIDQRIVTIEEGHALLPHVPADHGHGKPCCVRHDHHDHPVVIAAIR